MSTDILGGFSGFGEPARQDGGGVYVVREDPTEVRRPVFWIRRRRGVRYPVKILCSPRILI